MSADNGNGYQVKKTKEETKGTDTDKECVEAVLTWSRLAP